MKDPRDIILKPVVSEKSYALMETDVYTFQVAVDASKPEIHDAKIDGVLTAKVQAVTAVNVPTQVQPRKARRVQTAPSDTY